MNDFRFPPRVPQRRQATTHLKAARALQAAPMTDDEDENPNANDGQNLAPSPDAVGQGPASTPSFGPANQAPQSSSIPGAGDAFSPLGETPTNGDDDAFSATQEHAAAQKHLSDFTADGEPYLQHFGDVFKLRPTVRGPSYLPIRDPDEQRQGLDWLTLRAQFQDEVNRLKPAAEYEQQLAEMRTPKEYGGEDAGQTGNDHDIPGDMDAENPSHAASNGMHEAQDVVGPPTIEAKQKDDTILKPKEGVNHLRWFDNTPQNRQQLIKELARQTGEQTRKSGKPGNGTDSNLGDQREYGGFLIQDKKTGQIAITEITSGDAKEWQSDTGTNGISDGKGLFPKYGQGDATNRYMIMADLHAHPDRGDRGADNNFSADDMYGLTKPGQTWNDSFLAAPDGTIKRLKRNVAQSTVQMEQEAKEIGRKSPPEQTAFAYRQKRSGYHVQLGGNGHLRPIVVDAEDFDRWR